MTLFESVSPWLEAALKRSGEGLTLDFVAAEVSAGRVWLMRGAQSVLALKPDGEALHVWLAGGELGEVMAMEVAVTASARDAGFKRLTVGGGRRGWSRVLKARGWIAEGDDLVKEL